MKKIVLLLTLVIAGISIHAQTKVPLYQLWYASMDSTGTGFLPPHFSQSPVVPYPRGFWVDTTQSDPSGGYCSSIYWVEFTSQGTGASGLNAIDIKDDSSRPAGLYNLIISNISTLGYKNISCIWGDRYSTHFSDSGSYVGFYISTDAGKTWDSLPYIESQKSNSTWALVNNCNPIALPTSANNIANLMFKYAIYIHPNTSGSYRIDDFYVFANDTDKSKPLGINNINEANATITNQNNQLNIHSSSVIQHAQLFDMLGNKLKDVYFDNLEGVINVNDLAHGMYVVRLYTNDGVVTRKEIL